MSDARSRILGRLRACRAAPVALAPRDDTVASRLAPLGSRGLLQALSDNLRASHAEVFRCARGQWLDTLLALRAERQWQSLVLSGDLAFEAAGDQNGFRSFKQAIDSWKAELFDGVDVGVTRASCAIAETGTLALLSSPQSPRTLSLVPPINVCVVDAARLYRSLPEALATEGWATAMPSNLIFISGPSKTADIQQTLAYGAHGPKDLIVLIEGEASPQGAHA
jgi:L-lactate dehydrogenase complex protein LldG